MQLPPLRNLQRVIDELAFGVNNSQQSAATPSRLIVEQVGATTRCCFRCYELVGVLVVADTRQSLSCVDVASHPGCCPGSTVAVAETRAIACCVFHLRLQVPTIRAGLLHCNDWRALAEAQAAGQFGAEAQRVSQGRMERLMQSFDLMCGMEEQGASQNEVRRRASSWPFCQRDVPLKDLVALRLLLHLRILWLWLLLQRRRVKFLACWLGAGVRRAARHRQSGCLQAGQAGRVGVVVHLLTANQQGTGSRSGIQQYQQYHWRKQARQHCKGRP
jgi:hypothetical protein